MKVRDKCEICGFFKVVGFTDCGLICEECFNVEVATNAFNQGLEAAVKCCEKQPERLTPMDCAVAIRLLKKKTHLKEVKSE